MIYGIEQTTDLRDRQTKIKTFADSKKGMEKARDWIREGHLALAWPGTGNNHHRLRVVYKTDRRVPVPKKSWKDYLKNCGGSVYRRYLEDFHASAIRDRSTEITLK